jgi:predicted transcriptional regulator
MNEFVRLNISKPFENKISGLSPAETRLLNYLCLTSSPKNRVIYTSREIADATKLAKSTVSNAFKTLVEAGFCKRAQRGVYYLNPNYIWRDTESAKIQMIKKYNQM